MKSNSTSFRRLELDDVAAVWFKKLICGNYLSLYCWVGRQVGDNSSVHWWRSLSFPLWQWWRGRRSWYHFFTFRVFLAFLPVVDLSMKYCQLIVFVFFMIINIWFRNQQIRQQNKITGLFIDLVSYQITHTVLYYV